VTKAGLAHVQFETIHPFLEITFLLCAGGALQESILYLSLFFKSNRQLYYDLLTRVRTHGAWEGWLTFFPQGVKETSEQAVSAARRLLSMLEADRRKIEALGRSAATVLRLHQHAQTHPILSIGSAAKEMGIRFPTATSSMDHLQRLGIMREITFAYGDSLDILNEGTEPIR
jgi:Fic family protein